MGALVTESVFNRMRRVVSAGLESAADAAERASGTSLMRHAVRQVEAEIERLGERRRAAESRAREAERAQARIEEDAARLERDARFALDKEREDLARSLVSRQLECEAEARRLRDAEAGAKREIESIEAAAAGLALRKERMEEELKAVDEARREEAAAQGDDPRLRRRVERAEAAFERASRASGANAAPPPDAEATAAAEEVVAMRREDAVAARLDMLRSAPAGSKRKKARA